MDEDDNMESVRAIKKHWEATSTKKSMTKIKELLVQKTDIQIMNIIGEGIPNQITCSINVRVPPYIQS